LKAYRKRKTEQAQGCDKRPSSETKAVKPDP